MKKMTKRTKYFICFIVFLAVEVLIALFVHDAFIRPYVGDMLVVAVVYCLVRVIVPNGVKLMPLYVFLFAAAVECSQYFDFVGLLHLQNSAFFSVLLGATFDIKDIVCYAAGCLAIYAAEKLNGRKKM